MDESVVNIGPFSYTMSVLNGKWKMHILFWLWKRQPLRYGELKKLLGSVTHKMLSSHLKELEQDGLIVRREFHQVPPKVEYTLSEKGCTLMPILHLLCQWGEEHFEEEPPSPLT